VNRFIDRHDFSREPIDIETPARGRARAHPELAAQRGIARDADNRRRQARGVS
jgi:hypothetical protein